MGKVLIIAYYYPPFNNGGVQRILAFKKYLPRCGYDVDIITAGIEQFAQKEMNVYRFEDKRYSMTVNKSPIAAMPIKVFFRTLMWLGIVGDLNFLWKRKVLKNIDKQIDMSKYDYIIASFGPTADLEVGYKLSSKYGIPLVVDYRDGFMYCPVYVQTQTPFSTYKGNKIERLVARQAVLQIAVNKPIGDYYRKKYETETIDLYNGFDDEESFDEMDINLPEGFNIIYTGAMGISREIYDISKITRIIETNSNTNFIFIGSYTPKEIRELSKHKNVFLFKKMERKKIIPIQRNADMLLLITGDYPSGMTGKLFEYLFAKKPILNLGGMNEGAKIIQETDSGKTFFPDQTDDIQKFISEVKDGKVSFSYRKLEQYTRRDQCQQLANKLDQLQKGDSSQRKNKRKDD